MEKKTRVLIADDSALMRRTIRKLLEGTGHIDVVSTARDGIDVLEKAEKFSPDVITLDINMPRMDGLTALKKLIRKNIAPVIMISSLTQAGAETTIKALELGAFDCVGKPDGTVTSNMNSVAKDLERKISSAVSSGILKRLRNESLDPRKTRPRKPISSRKDRVPVKKVSKVSSRFRAIAIGISTGGPKTIFDVLPRLPKTLNAAIFLVQHMPVNFTSTFAKRIDTNCPMHCVEARSGMSVEPGTIYLGRGGYHLGVVKKRNGEVVVRTPSRPPHLFIPSVDVMMQSVLSVYGSDTIGLLMTGMGDDGANSMVDIRKAGGKTIAESEDSAIVWGMPGEAVARGGAEYVQPSWRIASTLLNLI
ncbi:chemotaxis protein CheY [Candidatus Magnetomorum sp. HK-1]|nr:chemotaxis protein CheY [Candidatus Magnetomorum sp. HK-1]